MNSLKTIIGFNALYLATASLYFINTTNYEFIIYVAVIVALLTGVFLSLSYTRFTGWMLWCFSFWGLLHVLGGLVQTVDGVLFAYRIYPFLDYGGDFYILKYDQVVHFYLYGVVAVMAHHILRRVFNISGHDKMVFLTAVLVSVGVSALNEIMEFFISLNMQNGVGGYENTMLDMCFNLAGALIATALYVNLRKSDGQKRL